MWWIVVVVLLVIIYRLIKHQLGKKLVSDIPGKYVFVTGCDTGFGHLLAIRLDDMGAHVIAGCLTEHGREKLNKKTTSRLVTVIHDVSNEDSTKKAVELVRDLLPAGKGLWGLVNNAGVLLNLGPCEWLRTEDYLKTFKVNLFGATETTRQFLPLLRRERGRIVNMSSFAGSVPMAHLVPYSMSKHGIEVYSDCLRKDVLRFGLTVHIIKPLGFNTGMPQLDVLKPRVYSLYSRVDEHVKEEYGTFNADSMYSRMDFLKGLSKKTYQVVDACVHAVLSVHPSYRYRVGNGADTYWRLHEFLPDCLSDLLYRFVNRD